MNIMRHIYTIRNYFRLSFLSRHKTFLWKFSHIASRKALPPVASYYSAKEAEYADSSVNGTELCLTPFVEVYHG